jgi:predicted CopG family antitoxin
LAPGQKKVSVTISVSSDAARMLRELRDGRVSVNEILEDRIQTLHQDVFGIPK